MAYRGKKGNSTSRSKGKKIDSRRIFVGVLAGAMALLLLLPIFSMIVQNVGAVTQSEIDALKEEQAASQARQEELKEELAEAKEDQAAAQEQRQILTQQLEAINDEIDTINAQIAYYDEEIAQKEEERKEVEAQEAAQYELFCQRVRAMEEEGTVSYWSILFNAESFSDLLDRVADVDAVMERDNQIMEELIATREELERLQADLETARAEEQAAKEQQEAKQADAAEIQAEITQKQQQLEEERKQNNVTISSETGYLWPLPGWYSLSSLFGYRIHPITGVAHSHTGIDIPASGGTPILASKSGQVVTSAYHYSYGNYVVIDHGNGNSTLYAHMSARAVSEGEMVTQGQVIGYVGTTGSSTGNHLHFEVRDNYTRVDPEAKFPNLSLTHPW